MVTAASYTRMLGNVKPWVAQNGIAIATKYNLSVIGGFRSTGSVPNSDHPLGLAVDFMCDIATGQRIVADVLSNWVSYNVKYVIHNRRIWFSPTKSQPYVGPSPHTDHVHVSYLSKPNSGSNPGIVGPGVAPPFNPTTPLNPFAMFEFLSDSKLWIRIGLAVGGALLMLFGLWGLMSGKVLDISRKVLQQSGP